MFNNCNKREVIIQLIKLINQSLFLLFLLLSLLYFVICVDMERINEVFKECSVELQIWKERVKEVASYTHKHKQ